MERRGENGGEGEEENGNEFKQRRRFTSHYPSLENKDALFDEFDYVFNDFFENVMSNSGKYACSNLRKEWIVGQFCNCTFSIFVQL